MMTANCDEFEKMLWLCQQRATGFFFFYPRKRVHSGVHHLHRLSVISEKQKEMLFYLQQVTTIFLNRLEEKSL